MKKLLLSTMAVGAIMAYASNASAQDHDFAGSYLINGFYMDYVTENYIMDPLPLVIDSENTVQNFAGFTPFTTIYGVVEGNDFTFTSDDEYIILEIDWDTFHYIVLNGETYGDDYEKTPIVMSYDADSDTYTMTSWMLWDYDPMGGTYEKLAYDMVFDVTPGEMPEEIDYTGSYTVSGQKILYVDGVAQDPIDDEFLMVIQPDEDGNYEFPYFAGYQVGLVPRGWLGVFGAVYGTDIEIQGTDIELDADGNGIKLAGPFMEYDDLYTVTVFFTGEGEGTVSDFDVWKMEAGEPVELLATWKHLSFMSGGETDAVKTIEESLNPSSEAPVYYDLQGRRIQNPSNGLYILRQGNTAKKVLIRK